MMRTIMAGTLVLGAVVSVTPDAHAQGAPGPVLRVGAHRIAPDGARRAAAVGTHEFTVGVAVTTFNVAGDNSRGDHAGCSVGMSDEGVRPLDTLVREHPYVWQLTTTPRAIETGRLVFDLAWKRFTNGDSARPAASGERRLTLSEGQTTVVDLLHPPADSACANTTITIEVEAAVREDPGHVDSLLQYELWLAHTDPSGARTSQRLTTSALHGMDLPFGFTTLRFPVPVLVPDQYRFSVTTRVHGRIRGRLTGDGAIVVDLEATRRDGLQREGAGDATPPWPGNGRKQLRLAAGEVVEIEVPLGTGYTAMPASAALAGAARGRAGGGAGRSGTANQSGAEAVAISNGRLGVNFKRFFEGHRVALVIRATRLTEN